VHWLRVRRHVTVALHGVGEVVVASVVPSITWLAPPSPCRESVPVPTIAEVVGGRRA